MVLLSQFRNGIKRGVHWIVKNIFNNVLFLMNGIHSFSGSSYHSTHICPFAICHSNYLVLFYFLSKDISNISSQKTFEPIFLGLSVCKYVCMQVCICVVMIALPASQNPLGVFNDEAFQLHQKGLNIVSQKSILFVACGKFE